ncbi:hypothetical protein Tco_1302479 [Tanacetum coccineum]
MATNEETNAAGTDTRPPMLVENDYESWKIRIHRYIRGKPNGKLIWKSIQNGPTPHPMVTDPPPANSTVMPAPRKKLDSEFNDEENKLEMADTQAEIILSQGLPRHIFNILNQTSTAKEIWDNVEMLMQGSGRTIQQRKEDLFDEYERFRAIGNESIHDYFVRFHKLVNDMKITQLEIPTHQMNTKFVNNLPAYWGKYVTNVKQNMDISTTPYVQIYTHLKAYEPHAKKTLKKRQEHLQDNWFSKSVPPTNNQLRTSSNSRTHATVHDGHIVTEPIQRKAPEAFLADVECTAPYDQPQALTTTNMFQANHEDAYDSDAWIEAQGCCHAFIGQLCHPLTKQMLAAPIPLSNQVGLKMMSLIMEDRIHRKKLDSEFNDEENKLEMADTQAEIILSQGLPRHIFNILNQTSTAKEIWDNVEMLMQGSGRTLQQRKEDLFDEYERFRAIGNESIHDYFVRFHKLVNDMKITQLEIPTHQMNTKFVNNLPAYWGKYVTNVKQNMDISTTPYVQIYTHLKAYEPHAKKTLKKQEQSTSIVIHCYVAHTTFPPTHNQPGLPPTQGLHATVHDGHIVLETNSEESSSECTAPYDQPQALTTTNMFQANHEGPNAAVAFIANLSSTSATNNSVNEVHSNNNQIFDNVDNQLNQEMHQGEHLDSDAETEIDDNTIPYHQYLLDIEAQNGQDSFSSSESPVHSRPKPNGQLIWKSIQNGPINLNPQWSHKILSYSNLRNSLLCPAPRKSLTLGSMRRKQAQMADTQAEIILSQGLPRHIFNILNQTSTAKEIWDNVEMLMQGSVVSPQPTTSSGLPPTQGTHATVMDGSHSYRQFRRKAPRNLVIQCRGKMLKRKEDELDAEAEAFPR